MPLKSPPRPPVELYLGIDPGKTGGLACIALDSIEAVPMPPTERDTWDWFRWYSDRRDVFAMIEWIHPAIQGVSKGTMSKLYGSYMRLRAFLVAAAIPFQEAMPAKWQRALGVSPRKPTETPTAWKNRLKAKAQELFPDVPVTLDTCDALLVAEYCRRFRQGRLGAEVKHALKG